MTFYFSRSISVSSRDVLHSKIPETDIRDTGAARWRDRDYLFAMSRLGVLEARYRNREKSRVSVGDLPSELRAMKSGVDDNTKSSFYR